MRLVCASAVQQAVLVDDLSHGSSLKDNQDISCVLQGVEKSFYLGVP